MGTGCSIAGGRVPMISTHTVTAADLVRPPMLTRTTRGTGVDVGAACAADAECHLDCVPYTN